MYSISLQLKSKILHSIQGFYDYQLRTISNDQRLILMCIVFTTLIISVLTNTATIIVIFKRKIRPFFRVCLLSLSVSDLLTTTFQSSTYLTQFSSEFIQIWHLGEVLCQLIPFITTSTLLVNSLTLLGIAIDRFMAVKKIERGSWIPNQILCTTFLILIWGLSAGIASPMISSYCIHNIYIGYTKPENRTIVIKVIPVQMCASDKNNNAYYYVIIFSIVFAPITIVFIWLNTVIAGDIWNRRKPNRNIETQQQHQQQQHQINDITSCKCTIKDSCNCSTISQQISSINDNKSKKILNNNQKNSKISQSSSSSSASSPTTLRTAITLKNCSKTRRESRHLRMFWVVMILIALFICLRLPTWIYLIIRLYGTYNEPIHWILHYTFGILSLFNCMLNPLFYTFLTETIQCSINLSIKIQNCCNLKSIFCNTTSKSKDANEFSCQKDECKIKSGCYCQNVAIVGNEMYKKLSK